MRNGDRKKVSMIDGLMKLTGHTLSEFLEAEPDIYSLVDLKVRYERQTFLWKESFSKET
jgi:hypothetical protein